MNKIFVAIFFVVLVMAYFSIIYVLAINSPRERVYDCSLAEISPDYPLEVKEGCRKLRRKLITA